MTSLRNPYLDDGDVRLYHGDVVDVLREMDAGSVQTCVTSPPYWGLRDYGEPGQIGLEPTPQEYVAAMVGVFREVRRVLRDDGTLWLNLGDSYAGIPTRCIRAGTAHGDVVLDPFSGAATTALVARGLGRRAIGIELNTEYLDLSAERLQQLSLLSEAAS